MTRNVAIVHFNTPELTEAAIKSLRKHGGEDYKIYILDNSNERPFTKKIKGVKVFNNRKGQIINFKKELDKFPDKHEKMGCARGCYYGSDVHMMSVQKLWELIPEGFLLMESDILIKESIDHLFVENECAVGYIYGAMDRGRERFSPLLLWINVPMCVAGGARFFDPDRSWALHPENDDRNFWDTGGAFLADIKQLKPQCHGIALARSQFVKLLIHYGSGSWKHNDLKQQQAWLEQHAELWK